MSFLLGSGEMLNGDNSELIKGWHSCQVHYEIVFHLISQQTCICLFHDAVTLWIYTCARMCRARRIAICFPVISSPMACTLLKQQAALVIGFILFLPLLCMDPLYLFCSPVRDSQLRRPHLPCCSWAWGLTVPDCRKAVFPYHTCCSTKRDTNFTVQNFPSPSSGLPTLCSAMSPWNTFQLIHFCSVYSSPALEKPVILPIQSFLLQLPRLFLTAVNLGRRIALPQPTRIWRCIHWHGEEDAPEDLLLSTEHFAEGRRVGPCQREWEEGQERAQHRASTAFPGRVCILLLLLLGVAITYNVKTTTTPIPNRHHPPPLCSTQEENCGEILLNYHTT